MTVNRRATTETWPHVTDVQSQLWHHSAIYSPQQARALKGYSSRKQGEMIKLFDKGLLQIKLLKVQ